MVAEDDDVDMESLQAQIDMSMSFAHNLVTSWIKPTHFTQLGSSGVNPTQILHEELRRPPRLGVGAPIPTAPPLAHEASKLQRRLGKNRAKHEDVMKSQLQDCSKSDDEEHKGRPAKRKTKVDPFGHEGSKKKKRAADPGANQYLSVESVSKQSLSLSKDPISGEPPKHNSSSGKASLQTEPGDQQSSVTGEAQSAMLLSSSPMRLSARSTFSSSPTTATVPSFSKPSQETYASSHTDSVPISDKANPLAVPLLNLDGPPEPTDKPGHASDLSHPRRKRKRRKKKKAQTINGSMGDHLH